MNPLNTFIKGECIDMCPIAEINLRERESLLHVLEILPGTEKNKKPKADRTKVVKSFCRSAAGKNMQNPKNLRPTETLLKTINYLLEDVIKNTKVRWEVTYDFITDRLRAVRQDMIIQNLPIADSICILQPIVNFHAYASYRLCNEPLISFDPVLNRTHLQECLKRLLSSYDQCENICLHMEKTLYVMQVMSKARPHFEALYLVLNLGNAVALTRALNLAKIWRNNLVNLAINVSLSYYQKNFVKVCRNMKTLPELHLALASLHLPEIRRQALEIMSVAYNSKTLTFPLVILKEMFLYNNLEDVIIDCEYYGLECIEKNVKFSRVNFDRNKFPVQSKRLKFIDDKLENIQITDLILNI